MSACSMIVYECIPLAHNCKNIRILHRGPSILSSEFTDSYHLFGQWLVGWFPMPHFDNQVICDFNLKQLAHL